MSTLGSRFLLLVLLCMGAGCANITAPTGGKKDVTPPKMVSIDPKDSLLNTRVKRIEIHFDEYITVGDAAKEVSFSPILAIQPTVTGKGKTVTVKIIDSLLEDNTTYRLSFGKAIKDLHEGNPYGKYTYTFSTGSYFDSLQLHGKVLNAATGLPDSGSITVELYYATDPDSAVVRHKPKYIAKTDASGAFTFSGLPRRAFRIYALKDANDNLIYDGAVSGDQVAFADNTVIPFDTSAPINLRLFGEVADTGVKKTTDTSKAKTTGLSTGRTKKQTASDKLTYTVSADTSNVEKRTMDITRYMTVDFSRKPILNTDRITLSCDSEGVKLTPKVTFYTDTVHPNQLRINTNWLENTVYTLKLAKGFAKDTNNADLMPSKYIFRTLEDDDYGSVTMRLPGKYLGSQYLFRVMYNGDSLSQRPITDTVISLKRLKPGKYTFRIIVDKNRNGKWDAGNLFKHEQPEEVIPYYEVISVKAGYQYDNDFEPKVQDKKMKDRAK